VRVFLMGDAVTCAKPGQTTPEGFYNIARMLKGLTSRGVEVGTCGSCMDARGQGWQTAGAYHLTGPPGNWGASSSIT